MSHTEISQDTVKRLVKDIKQVLKSDISKDGIYYKHDETNMLLGYALIIGPPDTPYEFGNFLFRFDFPIDYPYSPPKASYLTNDGKTRFHPNLYKNEKVCLSLLNTWKGEGWTSCQTIMSILLTLQSIMDNKPLLHEPGLTETHLDFDTYNEIVKYKTTQIAIARILTKTIYPDITALFWGEIIDNFKKNYDKIIKKIPDNNDEELRTSVYNMHCVVNYVKIKDIFKKVLKAY